ncbi:MAG TPA: hypothetical protein V6C88_13945 [Chroococcidiopsis sp.]
MKRAEDPKSLVVVPYFHIVDPNDPDQAPLLGGRSPASSVNPLIWVVWLMLIMGLVSVLDRANPQRPGLLPNGDGLSAPEYPSRF